MDSTKMCEPCKARRRELPLEARRERAKLVQWLHGRAAAFYESYDLSGESTDLNRGAGFLQVRLAVQRGEHGEH